MYIILKNACRMIRELEDLNQAKNEENVKRNKWEPPQGDFLKANFDGTTSERKNAAAMRIIIRNFKGEMVVARTRRISRCSPLRIECEATLLALRTTSTLGIKHLILEGDSMEVINLMEGALEECPQEIKVCIEDYQVLFPNLLNLNIKHVRREGKKVAHKIAKVGINNPNLKIERMPIPPTWLIKVLVEDAKLI